MSDAEKVEFAKYITETLLNNLDPDATLIQLQYQTGIAVGFLKNLQKVLNEN